MHVNTRWSLAYRNQKVSYNSSSILCQQPGESSKCMLVGAKLPTGWHISLLATTSMRLIDSPPRLHEP